jgi:hypothetical protein
MNNSLKVITAFGLAVVLSITGCRKKEQTAEVDNETQSAVDNAIAEQEYMAVVPTTQSHAINTKGTGAQQRTMAACDTLSLMSGDTLWSAPNHVNPTYSMTISNAVCSQNMPDGRFRTGHIRVRLTGKIRDAGSMMIIKFFNYQAATISYSCDSMVVTTLSSNAAFTSFNVKLFNGVCQKGNNWTINYSFDRTITFYPKGNPTGTDPVTLIYGTASGKNRQGRKFDVVVPSSTPLVKLRSCEYISGGILNLTPESYATRTIDYGYSISPAPYNGCDEDASYTVNGNTVAFKLK